MPNVYARTLKRAAEIVGSDDQLAFRLKVTPSHLALWLEGAATPPMNVFLQAVDVVSAHEVSRLRPPKG